MDETIKKVFEEVKQRCMLPTNVYGMGAWDRHIELVYKVAIENCKEYNADYEIVALAALLHDIASVTKKEYTENHHIIGADIAENLLQEYGLEKNKIEQIKNCILNHRGSVIKDKKTPEEICIADSDAMAHYYSIPSLLKMVYVNKFLTTDEGSKFVYDKLQRSYNKLSEIGKKIIQPRYDAANLILIKKEINEKGILNDFYNIPSLLNIAYVNNKMTIDDGANYVYAKLQETYKKLSDENKIFVKTRYDASNLFLNNK